MFSANYTQYLFKSIVNKIGDKEDDASFLDSVVKVLEGLFESCSFSFRFEREHLADDTEDVCSSFSWRNELLDLISKQEQTDLVVILHCGEGKNSAKLCGYLLLGFIDGTE